MNSTYRDIFKWGDKREEKVDKGTLKVVKEKLNFSDSDLAERYLTGEMEVTIEKPVGIDKTLLERFASIVGADNVKTDDYSRASYAYGKFYAELVNLRMEYIPSPPDAVISPRTTEEIIEIVKLCNEYGIAITPCGGLSSVTRGVETPKGGISLDLTAHLNKVINLNTVNATVTVQSGMFGPAFENYLNSVGFTCGHFPQSFEYSTVGGWFAAKGAGQASTGYGKIEHMVLAIKVVTPSGVIETKCFPASAQGWDLHLIFAGSEGTLGVITEITMKVRRYMPENTQYASFAFKNFESAVNAMRTVMQSGVGLPHLFRISDPEETEIAFKTKGFDGTFADWFLRIMGYKSGSRCLMFMGVDGSKAYAKQVKKSVKAICRKNGSFFIGASPTLKWLEQRYSSAYLRDPLMDIGIMTDTIETAVMWDNLVNVWNSARNYLKHRPKTVVMSHISHVYENGANLYFTFLSPMEKGNELNDYAQFHKGLVDTINASGGSLSHHHGVGRSLAPWMETQLGVYSLNLMQAIKNHLDPKGIMNPGDTLGLKP
ncbi:MAG: FAD-binding oxidoreductase [Bacteroidales bacterium]|jgi:alkyldihydroxyacetonephosphate synthase|nr:FAD-binding oxidoreductase [Bacteroidales bacterium]MDD4384615.1 FAD-binding oxidoreductase [Bacteroidales bacterium]MDY0196865.1 FAD-binding oxidoreductase [Tenuifilaceae bacterium]